MYTIGIQGQTGVGKTTICEYLQSQYGIASINVDNLMKENGLWGDLDALLFDLGNKTNKKYKRSIVNSTRIKEKEKLSLSAKAMIKFFILSKKVNRLVNKKLKEHEEKGEQYVIVDFAKSDAMSYWKKLDSRIFVKREEEKRKHGLKQREGNAFEGWIKKYDSFLPYTMLQYDSNSSEYTINNNGSLQQLTSQVDMVISQIKTHNKSTNSFRKTLNKKYPVVLSNITKPIGNTRNTEKSNSKEIDEK